MRGVSNGERVVLTETNGRVLQTAYGREGQPMFLDALMDPLTYQGLELVPEKPGALDQLREGLADPFRATADPGKKSLDVTGVLLNTRAEVQVPPGTEQIFASFSNGIPTLFVRVGEEVMGYDLSNPAIPRQYMSSWAAGAAAGAVAGAVAAGAAAAGAGAGAASANQVRSRGYLFVRRENLIEQYSVAGKREPVFLQSHDMQGVREILAPPVSQGTSLLVRFKTGKDCLYQISARNTLVVSIAYHVEPWWVNTVPFNRLLLRLDKRSSTVSINEYGVSKAL
jgi:hypothetical protein